jgi:hypothetical protein
MTRNPEQARESPRVHVDARYASGSHADVELVEPLPIAFLLHHTLISGDPDWQPGKTPAEVSQTLLRFVREKPRDREHTVFIEDPNFSEVSSARFVCSRCHEPHDVLYLVPGESGDLRGAHRWCEECYASSTATR